MCLTYSNKTFALELKLLKAWLLEILTGFVGVLHIFSCKFWPILELQNHYLLYMMDVTL